ncbi:GntR family transcriptional regulator [Janibacter sp. UYMM211]|uniref:GntR family transcriptional regulator n=1 Tax=Janibacter sp. UYMM211 TaxID=3156342 RepID=UPI0033971B2A
MTPHQGKAVQAYHRLEQMIVFQDVEPGSLMSEAQLMELTGLGRTPVREALQRLARNGMVEIHPNKGVLIPPTSVEAQLRMLELRRVLEALAVCLACQRATAADREEMRGVVRQLEVGGLGLREYAETIKSTHDLLARSAHNEYLADALAPLQGLSRRFWYAHVVDERAEVKAGGDHHTSILHAVLDRDTQSAEAASHALNDYLVEFSYATLRSHTVPPLP